MSADVDVDEADTLWPVSLAAVTNLRDFGDGMNVRMRCVSKRRIRINRGECGTNGRVTPVTVPFHPKICADPFGMLGRRPDRRGRKSPARGASHAQRFSRARRVPDRSSISAS
jgi:hypothetical protein